MVSQYVWNPSSKRFTDKWEKWSNVAPQWVQILQNSREMRTGIRWLSHNFSFLHCEYKTQVESDSWCLLCRGPPELRGGHCNICLTTETDFLPLLPGVSSWLPRLHPTLEWLTPVLSHPGDAWPGFTFRVQTSRRCHVMLSHRSARSSEARNFYRRQTRV